MLDVLTIAALVDELNSNLVDGRIQQIAHIDERTIACEIYAAQRRRWLILSADNARARAHFTERPVSLDNETVTPFLLLLRKYARGGRIIAVSQPRYERILRLSIAKPLRLNNERPESVDTEDADLTYSDLLVETMGRRSNLILIDQDGRIREAVKRVTPAMSRARVVLPGKPYVLPPPQEKLDPLVDSVDELLRDAITSPERLDRWLVARYFAISPVLGREVAVRAGIEPTSPVRDLQAPEAQRLLVMLSELLSPLETGTWQPMTYAVPGAAVIASSIRLYSVESVEGMAATPCQSISAAIDAAVADAPSLDGAGPGKHAARRERLVAEIAEGLERAEQRVRSLETQAALAEEADSWRRMGEAIYASVGMIRPGDREVIAHDGTFVSLDPALSVTENAQGYFERYRKARSAELHIPELLAEARQRVAYLNQLLVTARQAERFDDIEAARYEWLAWNTERAGAPSSKTTKPKRPPANVRRPRSLLSGRGDRIWIGRSGPQNETVTFDIAGPADLWLHARNMPGAHVILRWSGPADDDLLERAASLAAWYSAGRASTLTDVDVTERRNVRKIRGAGPGLVTYRNERTLAVHPRSESELGFESG